MKVSIVKVNSVECLVLRALVGLVTSFTRTDKAGIQQE